MVHKTEPHRRKSGAENGAGTAQEAIRSAKLRKGLPRGIVIGERHDGRKKPWYVRWGRQRTVESFETEALRNDRAAKLADDREKEGSRGLDVDVIEWKAYCSFKSRTGATLADIEQAWHSRPKWVASPMITGEAITKYIALRETEGMKPKTDTHRHVTLHLRRFHETFGPSRLDAISTEMLRSWIAGLTKPDTGEPMHNQTKRDHRKDVNTFMKRCVFERWLVENPCERVLVPKVSQKDRPPMPAVDIFKLLKANRAEPVVGRLALELYASMRTSSAARCQKSWIKWGEKGIKMPGVDPETEDQQHKSGKSKYRQGHPDVLWDWLKHAGEACWAEIDKNNYGHKKGDAFVRAGVLNPGNGLRRSCASYQLAITKNVGPVSYLMQHKHTATTLIYEGEASERDARLFMAMTPAAVLLSWEDFLETNKTAA